MKIILWIVITPFIVLGLFIVARLLLCNPNREVIKVASPIAKIIADDIVKNGIPKSLKDIEGLSYELEGCERSEVYKKGSPNRIEVKTKDKADYIVITETCYFEKNNLLYSVELWAIENFYKNSWSNGNFYVYNLKNHTGIKYLIKQKQNTNKWYIEEFYLFDNKTSGICTTFKQ